MAQVSNFLGITLLVIILPGTALAREYVVGDDAGWSYDADYYAWVNGKTFHVGDVLVFNYEQDDHNVIVVNSTGYDQCLSSPNLGAYESGNDRIPLESPGNHFYICQYHCDYPDQRLNVTVLPSEISPAPSFSPSYPSHKP